MTIKKCKYCGKKIKHSGTFCPCGFFCNLQCSCKYHDLSKQDRIKKLAWGKRE